VVCSLPPRAAAEDHRPDGRPLHLRCSTASVASILYIDPSSAFVVTHQAEIYFSVVQRKVVTPNDFSNLDALEAHLLAFGRRYEQIATPFEWKFTRRDLHELLAKADTTQPLILAA
jgi:hypothetical protein